VLVILNDPSGVTGINRHQLDRSITLQANIERHLSGGADAELRINGLVVDPLTDRRLDLPPSVGDVVIVALRPRGLDPVSWLYIAYAVLVAYTLYAASQNRAGDSPSGKDSPNNKLTAQRNVARAYQAIPDVYGHRRCWPDLIQPSTTEYIDQLKYVTEWMCISRGLGTIADVRYAETPIEDIDGSDFEVFEPTLGPSGYPEHGTTTLTDVFEAFSSDEVNGQELPYAIAFGTLTKDGGFVAVNGASTFTVTIPNTPDLAALKSLAPSGTADLSFLYNSGSSTFEETCTVLSYLVAGADVTFTFSSSAWAANWTEASTFTITPHGMHTATAGPFTMPLDCSRLWWNVVFLRGLKGAVTIRSEWWQIDEDDVEIGGTRQTQDDTFTANTYDQRFYTVKVAPSAGFGRYRMQFTRITLQVDDGGADVAKLEEVFAVRHYPTKALPGATMIRVTTKATLAATGFSDRKFNLRWTRKVRGLTGGTLSASRNFARTMAHIWTIAGNNIAGLDVDALSAINVEHGENSPLLRFDGSLDDADMSLGDRLAFVADTVRCIVWRDGTQWTVSRDQARQYPEIQLDYRNLAGSGESVLSYAAHLPASFDGVELEYVDEASQSKKSYERWNVTAGVPVQGTSSNPKKVKMLGCATQAQAQNRALLEARKIIYQRVNVTDTALMDASDLGRGALVRWVDPNDFGGDELQAGEVMSIADDIITTSEPLNWGVESSGRMQFTGADGRLLGAPVSCYPEEAGVRLAFVPAGLYVADSSRQCGSRYSFATGLTSAEMESAGLYTTTQIKPNADGTVSIALIAYDSRIYEGDA
jgi:Putative phage tail protein